MNYTTGIPTNNDCVCAKEPQVVVPPLEEQIAVLTARAENCFCSVNRLFYFLNGKDLAEDHIEDKTITANIAYVIRLLNEITTRAESLSERWH